jgi:hypothetical protein
MEKNSVLNCRRKKGKKVADDEKKTEVELIDTEPGACQIVELKRINLLEKFDLKGRLRENDRSLEELFRKKVKICLERLKNSKVGSNGSPKKVGKATWWKKGTQEKMLEKHLEELKMNVEIYVRKVKWKKKGRWICIGKLFGKVRKS